MFSNYINKGFVYVFSLFKVVDQLMNSICKTVTAVLSTGRYDMVWLAQVMVMLSQHTQLIPAIIVRLWHLLTEQVSAIYPEQVRREGVRG